jgi:hypothetical protein
MLPWLEVAPPCVSAFCPRALCPKIGEDVRLARHLIARQAGLDVAVCFCVTQITR